MITKHAPVSVELVGGLGNQLFTYFAGLYIARALKVNLRIVFHGSILESVRRGHGLYAFKGAPTASDGSQYVSKLPWFSRFKTYIYSILSRSGAPSSLSERVTGVFQSTAIGEDKRIDAIRTGCFVRGYFQTRKYFESLRGALPGDTFQIQNPSSWFTSLKAESKRVKPIMVHVRRGDYLDPQNSSIGALSAEYFLRALSVLRLDPDLQRREVWIFSNDVPFVKFEFKGKVEGTVRWVESPPDSPEAESLILLGSGEALIMSNSTFSWWAASIGRPRRVIAPSKWFKGSGDPLNLMPPEWDKIDSSWL